MKNKIFFIAAAIVCMTAMQALANKSTVPCDSSESNCDIAIFDEDEPDEKEWEKDENEHEWDENENERDEDEPDEDEGYRVENEDEQDEDEPDEQEYDNPFSQTDRQAVNANQFSLYTANDDNEPNGYGESEEFDEEEYYDDKRDAELDSLRRMVSELQSSVKSTEEALAESESESRNHAIWNDRAKYFNIYYVNQSLTQKDIDGTWNNDFGVALAMGKTFYLHKKPILGMIKFGIDWSYFDINFSKYKDKWGFFNGEAEYNGGNNYWYDYGYSIDTEDVYQGEIGTAIGVSITVNPFNHIKAAGYFRVVPSYSMLYAAEDFSGSYGTFFLAGGSVAYKVISLGIEGRWGTAKYDSVINVSDIDSDNVNLDGNYDGSSKWKTGSVRFYISFRF